MSGFGILQQAVKVEKVNKVSATHFALCKKKEIRYLISVQGGKKRLSKNISAYSRKLSLLMRVLNYVPYSILQIGGVGFFVEVTLHPAIDREIHKLEVDEWNLIIGTYDEKQKLVVQCFNRREAFLKYIKIGNHATESELKTEIRFLEQHPSYQSFEVPSILGSRFADTYCPFNMQITKAFVGKKVSPSLTEEIVEIYQEIARQKKKINGKEYEFSHGDFAPWNIKKTDKKYVVFDWEHCGFRMPRFDLVYYCTVVNHILLKEKLEVALEHGLKEASQYVDCSSFDRQEFIEEYKKIHLQIVDDTGEENEE